MAMLDVRYDPRVWRFVPIVFAACRIADLDYTGKACPCPTDYTCELTTNTCQRGMPNDARGSDANDAPVDADPYLALRVWFTLDASSGRDLAPSAPTSAHGYIYNTAEVGWLPSGGELGGALHFSGVGGQAWAHFPDDGTGTCINPPQIVGSFTASTWVKFDRFQTWDYTLSDVAIMHGTTGGTEGGWGIGATDACGTTTAGIAVAIPAGTNRATRCGTTPLSIDTWYHITGVYDATARSLAIYVNGVIDNGNLAPGSIAIPSSIHVPPGCPFLAASAQQAHMLQGALDEVRIYERALTATEVLEVYRASGGT